MQPRGLQPSLGIISLTLLGLGCVIGTGIWVLTGRAAAEFAGPGVVISFLIAGGFSLIIALCYGELASAIPSAGSAYAYSYVSMGRFAGWMTGLLTLLAYGLAAATVAVGWSGYVVSFLGDIGVYVPDALQGAPGISGPQGGAGLINLPAIIGLAGASLVLCFAVSHFAAVNNILTLFKVGVAIAFIVLGLAYVDPANWTPLVPAQDPPPPAGTDMRLWSQLTTALWNVVSGENVSRYGIGGVIAGAAVVLFGFFGFEAPSAASEEAKNARHVPSAIVATVLISIVLYIGVTLVAVGVVPYTDLSQVAPIAYVGDAMGLPWFGSAVKLAAIAGLSTLLLTLLYAQSRVFLAMSRDGLMPPIFGALNGVHVPAVGTLITGAVAAAVAGLLPLDRLANLTNLGLLAVFALVCVSVIALRVTRPTLARSFSTPLYPIPPLIGAAVCVLLVISLLSSMPMFELIVFFGGGLALFFLSGAWRISKTAARMLTPEEDDLAYATPTLRAPTPAPPPHALAPPPATPGVTPSATAAAPAPPPRSTPPPTPRPSVPQLDPNRPTDVFISYRRKEKPRVEAIAQALRDLQLKVWFDAHLEAGRNFDEEINHEVRSAKAVLVCWSNGAVESRWVRAEADIGHRRNVLVACFLEACDPWTPFNLVHREDLSGGVLDGANTAWIKIIDRISRLTNRPGLVEYVQLGSDRAACEQWLARYDNDPLAEVVAARLG